MLTQLYYIFLQSEFPCLTENRFTITHSHAGISLRSYPQHTGAITDENKRKTTFVKHFTR